MEHRCNNITQPPNTAKSKEIAQLGLLTAISCMLVYLIHIPIFPVISFIKYDPGDIPILIGTLLFGPGAGLLMTVAVSIAQGLLVEGGVFDAIMHVLATGTLVITSGMIFKRTKTQKGAAVGFILGTVGMSTVMLMANFFITPLYLGVSSATVIPLLPYIVLFNVLKAGVNSAITWILFKKLPHWSYDSRR